MISILATLGLIVLLLAIINEAFKYLQRKKYFDKTGRPTKKLYKLVDLYDVRIKQVEDGRKENAEADEIENQ